MKLLKTLLIPTLILTLVSSSFAKPKKKDHKILQEYKDAFALFLIEGQSKCINTQLKGLRNEYFKSEIGNIENILSDDSAFRRETAFLGLGKGVHINQQAYSHTDKSEIHMIETRTKYKDGKTEVQLYTNSGDGTGSLYDIIKTSRKLNLEKFYLPYFDFDAKKEKLVSKNQFGENKIEKYEIATNLKVVAPDKDMKPIILRNRKTGNPILNKKGKPFKIDVQLYSVCLQLEAISASMKTSILQSKTNNRENEQASINAQRANHTKISNRNDFLASEEDSSTRGVSQ